MSPVKKKSPRRAHGERARVRAGARLSLGVDIGGTFTDFALIDSASGAVHAAKVLTNYKDLTEGVLEGVRQLQAVVPAYAGTQSNRLGSGPGLKPSGVYLAPERRWDRVVHGTTLATNALITRKGGQ